MKTWELGEYIDLDFFDKTIGSLTDKIEHIKPSEFIEKERYLPNSVTSNPGPYRFKINPYMKEILDCFDDRNDVREVNLMKGVQVTYSTVAECVLMYAACYLKTVPTQWLAQDDVAVKKRVENYILPMFQQSNWDHIIQSNDLNSTKKAGQKTGLISWRGGGFCVTSGVQTGGKLRSDSIKIQIKDELDAWPITVGKDGCPDGISDDRCSAFWESRKIFRGSTPLEKGTSKIFKRYKMGDQRHYNVRCKHCGFLQPIKWSGTNKENGVIYGFHWDTEDEMLINESVRYCCQNCGGEHYEHDKTKLFALEYGAQWVPTAKPIEKGIRSYLLPAFYSPIGMQPWYKCVAQWLKSWDVKNNRMKDPEELKKFYNNVLGEPFAIDGSKLGFRQVSGHRRSAYRLGEIPNTYAIDHAESKIHFLTCAVDVHGNNLRVAVYGHASHKRVFQIEDLTFEGSTENMEEGPWLELDKLLQKTYLADNGDQYEIELTLIDAGYNNATVVEYCNQYEAGVLPILGRDRPAKAQTIMEFGEFTTQLGTVGFRITVDIYKDRLSNVLKKKWIPGNSVMPNDFYSAPVDMSDKGIKEFTVESRKEKLDTAGNVIGYFWDRPKGVNNESWDLYVYNSAACDIMAKNVMMEHFGDDGVDWDEFWKYLEDNEPYIKK